MPDDIQVTVPDCGHLIGDGGTLIRLRTIASDVGCTSYELEDEKGNLSIVLHFPSFGVDDSTEADVGLRWWRASRTHSFVCWMNDGGGF